MSIKLWPFVWLAGYGVGGIVPQHWTPRLLKFGVPYDFAVELASPACCATFLFDDEYGSFSAYLSGMTFADSAGNPLAVTVTAIPEPGAWLSLLTVLAFVSRVSTVRKAVKPAH